MKENKSIDGLVPRSAKKSTPISVPTTIPRTVEITVDANPDPLTDIIDDSLEIKVNGINPDIEPSKPTTPSTESVLEDFLTPTTALDLDIPAKKSTKNKKSTPRAQKSPKEEKLEESPKSPKQKKKPSKARRIASIIALIIVFIIIGFALWAVFWGNDIIAKITGGQGTVFDLFTFVDEKYEPLKTDTNGRTNILAFGTSGYNMEGDEGNGTHAGAQLTDSIMMISLNQETGDILMLSLPRDLKASPTCTATGKINEVYWCNNIKGDNELAGAEALMTEVGSILGVDFQYYAHLNWGSLVSIVDILGGIQVTLDEDIQDYYYTKAVYEAGVEYTLNGAEALGLARARHGTIGGDFSRGNSQQKIIIGIKDKIFEKSLSMTDLIGLASTLGDNLRTNFSLSEIKTLAHLTGTFDFDSMRSLSLYPNYMTTGNINGISYVIPRAGVGNYNAIREYVAAGLSNDPRTYEAPTILILNATDTAGLAAAERTKLIDEGYKSVDIDDAPEGECIRGYILYSNHEKPGTEDLLEEYYAVEAWNFDEMPSEISRDYDFVLILNPKTEEE